MRSSFLVILALLLGACSLETRPDNVSRSDFGILGSGGDPITGGVSGIKKQPPISRTLDESPRAAIVETGTGHFVDGQSRKQIEIDDAGRGITLNFVDVEIQEFVRAVFDEVLKQSVVVDSNLKGRVTVRTPGPVTAAVAQDLVRQALQASGATLIQSGGIYRVATKSDQKSSKRLGDTLRLIPLTYIGADEAKTALGAIGSSGVEISTGPSGQYLSISGPATDLDNIEEVIATLDVDQMKGMSFGLFPLKEASATAVANELHQMFNKDGTTSGFRSMPITRMNAVLVLSPRPHLLAAARKWIARLDQADQDQRKIYVYPVQNRRAVDIAKLLSQVVQSDKSNQLDAPGQNVSPGLTPVSSTSSSNRSRPADTAPATTSSIGNTDPTNGGPMADNKTRSLRISADQSTNSIVVTASVTEWKIIEAALQRLDIMPPQVFIEATIAEVTLNSSLQHGVQWFFQKGAHSVGLTSDPGGAVAPTFPGFNYTFGLPQAQVVLSALEQVTDVQVISSPALTVLDNETARLQVGDQVPIATSSSQSTVAANAPIVNNIELKDTGVILSVTPRVNASGLVLLDISQEVSDVVQTTTSNLNSPTIEQRKLNSSVAVTSGHEIVLGGLISINRNKSDSGIPALMDVPGLGNLFKSQSSTTGVRTELIVILRPTVLGSNRDIARITAEIKQRMSGVRGAIYH